MKNGFWNDFEDLKKEIPDAEWGYLENEPEVYKRTPYDLLHGECNHFAQYLQDTYGYKIEGFYEEPNQMVHTYCKTEFDGTTYYIDIRGITDDWDEFIKEFYDAGCWGGDYDYSYYLADKDVNSDTSVEDIRYGDAYKASKHMVEEYRYYDIRKLKEKLV